MEAERLHYVIVFVVFLCVLAAYSPERNRVIPGTSTSNGISWIIQDIDDETIDQTLTHCREELKDRAEAVETLESYLRQAATDSYYDWNPGISLLPKRVIKKVVVDLPLQEKQTLLSCLRYKSHAHHGSGKDIESKTWLSRYEGLFHEWSYTPRRYLRRRKIRLSTRVSLLAPAPGPVVASGGYAQVPSPQMIASSPSPTPQPYSPTQSPAETPEPPAETPEPPAKTPEPPPRTPKPATPKDPIRPPSSVSTHPPPKQHKSPDSVETNKKNEMFIIAAAASTAVVGLALITLLLFCFLKSNKNKVGPKDGQRDEKPLLNISSSGLSPGSAGISNNKDVKLSSTRNLSNRADNHDQALAQPLEVPESTSMTLPLPPGRSGPPTPNAPPPNAHSPPPPPKPPAPRPPPPPKVARPAPNPPKLGNSAKPSPLGPHHRGRSSIDEGSENTGNSDAPKAKLKPLFWDKVLANPDHSMVWHDIKAGSFQFNEELMESLFGYVQSDQGKNERKKSSSDTVQYIQIIDPRKAQNLAILLKALNVTTEEVCDALKEGNELPAELIQTLLKMAPTTEEELKLRLYSGDLSQLGPAERFLKVMVEIPFAVKRLESLLFMSTFQEEVSSVKESFASLEVACQELRNSRLFMKLLEAVLKTGNRMNNGTYRGGAQAFKLDTLLKLSDVKGTDGKTTLLHFVVQEIIRSEGARAARRLRESPSISSAKTEDFVEDSPQDTAEYHRSLGLQVVSGLSGELENVKRAALIDMDNLSATISNIGHSYRKSKDFLNKEMQTLEGDCQFRDTLASFVEQAEADVMSMLEEEKRIMALVKSAGDYFHGNAGKDEGLRLFVVVRSFLLMLDKTCKEVRDSRKLPVKAPRKERSTVSSSQESHLESLSEHHKRLFPSIKQMQMDDSSSDDES